MSQLMNETKYLNEIIEMLERALNLVTTSGDSLGEATILHNLAVAKWNKGEFRRAITHMETSHAINARSGVSTKDQDYYINRWRSQMGSKE